MEKLFATLIERNLINTNTVVTATLPTVIFGGAVVDKRRELHWNSKIPCNSIHEIEGMDPVRYARSYDIKPDGSVKTYKRRGRKPKVLA